MELTAESAMEVLRAMFPEALRIYISEDADYFDGVLATETFILITHDTFRAPTLSEAMSKIYKFAESQRAKGVAP